MKSAIVTGASSGIGKAITLQLIELGYAVTGLARRFDTMHLPAAAAAAFTPLVCDVTDVQALQHAVQQIKQQHESIDVLINNAGVGWFGPHETLQPENIAAMVATNLQAPLILSSQLLRELRPARGWIINISSITATKSSTHGCAYAAAKAGLSHFGRSLFDEVRKSGVRVVTVHPDMTQTNFYAQADFQESPEPDAHLKPEDVAETIRFILSQRDGAVITELMLQPQKHRIQRKPR